MKCQKNKGWALYYPDGSQASPAFRLRSDAISNAVSEGWPWVQLYRSGYRVKHPNNYKNSKKDK